MYMIKKTCQLILEDNQKECVKNMPRATDNAYGRPNGRTGIAVLRNRCAVNKV